jgi:hypothetical protein
LVAPVPAQYLQDFFQNPFETSPHRDPLEARRHRAIVALAAPLACLREFGPAGLYGADTDGFVCRALISEYDLDEGEIRAAAKAIVDGNWRMIRRLAYRLYFKG